MASQVVRVAVVGPESSGKTTLCRMLAAALADRGVTAAIVPEYAREYYRDHPYDPSDPAGIVAVAVGQSATESAVATVVREGVVICDTTALTCQVWAEEALGSVPDAVAERVDVRAYAVHLVCRPLAVWTPDPLRVSPSAADRQRQFERYVEVLVASSAACRVLSGDSPAERLAEALAALDTLAVGAVT